MAGDEKLTLRGLLDGQLEKSLEDFTAKLKQAGLSSADAEQAMAKVANGLAEGAKARAPVTTGALRHGTVVNVKVPEAVKKTHSSSALPAWRVGTVADVLRVATYYGAEPATIAALPAAEFHELLDVAKRGSETTTAELRKQMLQKAKQAANPAAVDPKVLERRIFVSNELGLSPETVAKMDEATLSVAFDYAMRKQGPPPPLSGGFVNPPAPPMIGAFDFGLSQSDYAAYKEAVKQKKAAPVVEDAAARHAAKEARARAQKIEMLRREVKRLEGQAAGQVEQPVELQTKRLITLDEE